jgi:Holliday junction resolvasome RuvABC DNA-binding subunit
MISIALNGKNCDEPPKIDQKMAGHLLIELGKKLKKVVNEDMQVINMVELRKRYKKFIEQFV